MERHPNDLTTDEELDAAIAEESDREDLTIVEASWHRTPGFGFLMMKLSNGRRVLVPREELRQLKNATEEQAADMFLDDMGYFIWWPQVDDGLLLENFARDNPDRVIANCDSRTAAVAA